MQAGSQLLGEVVRAFGPQVLREDGSLDRSKLSRDVFGDPEAVARLNALTHPPVKAEIRRRLEALRREGKASVVCVVAPLLLEAGCEELVDRLLVLVAGERERIRRVVARDGLGEDEVKQRMAAQLPPEAASQRADWVVDTTPGREAARRRLESIWGELVGQSSRLTDSRAPADESTRDGEA
jgi:dephospho-CoA kinase